MDFTEYQTAAKYAYEINQGYTANLCGVKRCPYRNEAKKAAWHHGYDLAQQHIGGKDG